MHQVSYLTSIALVAVATSLPVHAGVQPAYELHILPGSMPSVASAINDAGDVAGSIGEEHVAGPLAVWTSEGAVITYAAEGANRFVTGISDAGTLVGTLPTGWGWALQPGGGGYACVPEPSWCTPDYFYASTRVLGISGTGLFTGALSLPAPEGLVPLFQIATEAFVGWFDDDGVLTVQRLGQLGGQQTVGWAINNAGVVVGTAGGSPFFSAVVFRDGVPEQLPDAGGTLNRPLAITNSGTIAGFVASAEQENGGYIAGSGAIWTEGEDGAYVLTKIGQFTGPLGTSNVTSITDINEDGFAIGFARRMHASVEQWNTPILITSDGNMLDIHDLLPAESGWRIQSLLAINASGRIAAVAVPEDGGPSQAVRLDPVASNAIAGDMNGDGRVNGTDLVMLLASWGPCADCPADMNGDGVVDGNDLLALLAAWSN